MGARERQFILIGPDGLQEVTELAEISVEAVEDTHGKTDVVRVVAEGIARGYLEDPSNPDSVLERWHRSKIEKGLITQGAETYLREYMRTRKLN